MSEQQLRKYYVYNAHTEAEESWKYYVLHVPKNEGFYNAFFFINPLLLHFDYLLECILIRLTTARLAVAAANLNFWDKSERLFQF